jgi:hypothetical protein
LKGLLTELKSVDEINFSRNNRRCCAPCEGVKRDEFHTRRRVLQHLQHHFHFLKSVGSHPRQRPAVIDQACGFILND